MAGEPLTPRRGHCDCARQWSSLRLDGELSDLEGVLLERHLDACSACREFDRGLARTTALVRSAPLEEPATRFEPPARVLLFPTRRRTTLAGIAAAAALGALVGSLLERPAAPAEGPASTQVSFLTRDLTQLRQLPRPTPVKPAPEPRNPPEGVI